MHAQIGLDGDQLRSRRQVAQVGADPGTDLDHACRVQAVEGDALERPGDTVDVAVQRGEEPGVEPAPDGVVEGRAVEVGHDVVAAG